MSASLPVTLSFYVNNSRSPVDPFLHVRRRIVTVVIHIYLTHYYAMRIIRSSVSSASNMCSSCAATLLTTTQKRQIELKPANCISVFPVRTYLELQDTKAHVLHFIRSLFRDM